MLDIHFIYLKKKYKKNKHINILYISDVKQRTYHFVWIKDFNRFMSGITNSHHNKYFCRNYVLLLFGSNELLEQHNKDF